MNLLFSGQDEAAQSAFAKYGIGADGSPRLPCRLLKAYLYLLETAYDRAAAEIQDFLEGNRAQGRVDVLGQGLALLAYCAYRMDRVEGAQGYLISAQESSMEQGYFANRDVSLIVLSLMLTNAGAMEQAAEISSLIDMQYHQSVPLFNQLFRHPIRN